MPSQTEQRILNADLLRVLALFAVVGIHLLNPIYARPDFFGGKFWWVCFLLNALFRASVPLFVMLSGYLLLGKETSIRANLSRTWNRIAVPLLGFYAIICAYKAFLASTRSKPYDLWVIFHDLSKGSASYLYFLVIILFLYLLIPLFKRVFEGKDQELPKYLIGLFFINALFAATARYTSLRLGEVFNNTYTMWVLWVGYFLIGYWIRQSQAWLKMYRKQLLAAFVVAFACTLGFGYLSWGLHWKGNDALYMSGMTYPEEYLSINVVVMSVSAFILILGAKLPRVLTENSRAVQGLKLLSELSFGVYLIHVLVIDIMNNFFGITADNPAMPNLPIYVLINTVLTITISLFLAWIVGKTPYLKKLLGRS